MARHIRPRGNVVGPFVRRARVARELSQPDLAAKCQRMGWNVGRDIIARIEARVRLVTDTELLFLAKALQVPVGDLFPPQARISSRSPVPLAPRGMGS
jgi:transcriptional regulator with XRE-family HTH domain